jgi:uncharacterized protein YfdQ (DUF2303 family)
MTTFDSELLDTSKAAVDAIADLATAATEPSPLAVGNIYLVTRRDGHSVIDLTGDEYRELPKRKVGNVVMRDVPSFAAYWAKHADLDVSEVYANREGLAVTAVLDANGPEDAGWGHHRLVLKLVHSEAYKAWQALDGRLLDQEAFAEFLDDNRADVVEPSAAELLEIAQTIQGTSKVDWQAGHRLVDGQRRIGYTETNSATAGTKGELAIPAVITIGVPIFDGAAARHAITARFRHRITGGKLQLMYKLDRPADVVTAAFDAVVADVADQCAATVMRGTPA